MRILDLSRLPREAQFTNDDKSIIDMSNFVRSVRPTIDTLMRSKLIAPKDNVGIAFCEPQFWDDYTETQKLWNEPEKFVWFIGGWGSDPDKLAKYQANAVRKLRPLLRDDHYSTLDMRDDDECEFRDVTEAMQPDGSFAWGDYPWSGAVRLDMFGMLLTCAVSGLTETEDHVVAELFAGLLGKRIVEANNLHTH